MKNTIFVNRLFFFVFVFFYVNAYQPNEQGGLLDAITGKEKPVYLAKEPLIGVFEKDDFGNNSRVLRIEGVEHFKHFVLKNPKPVVLFVWAETSLDSKKMKPLFLQVADFFKEQQVQCAAMNILFEQDKQLPNYQIVAQVMQAQNIFKIDIPLFIFFKDGSLFTPQYYPPAFLQGPDTVENLIQKIKTKFFPDPAVLANVLGMDVTVTTTVPMSGGANKTKPPVPATKRKSWWRRFWER